MFALRPRHDLIAGEPQVWMLCASRLILDPRVCPDWFLMRPESMTIKIRETNLVPSHQFVMWQLTVKAWRTWQAFARKLLFDF